MYLIWNWHFFQNCYSIYNWRRSKWPDSCPARSDRWTQCLDFDHRFTYSLYCTDKVKYDIKTEFYLILVFTMYQFESERWHTILNEIHFLYNLRISMRRNHDEHHIFNAIELRNGANSCVSENSSTGNNYTQFGWSENTDPYYTVPELTGVV